MKQFCKNCKHWIKAEDLDERAYPIDEDTFELKKMLFEVRYCRHPRLMRFERPIEIDQASVVDGSDYIASLLSGPEFGCIHFES